MKESVNERVLELWEDNNKMELAALVMSAENRIAALEEALTPSTETKIAYWGDDNLIGDWQAIKDIMTAIKKRADDKLK